MESCRTCSFFFFFHLAMCFLRFIHVACISSIILWLNTIPLHGYIGIYLSVSWQVLVLLPALIMKTTAAVNIYVQVSVGVIFHLQSSSCCTSLLTVNIVSLHFYPFLWAYSGALWLLNIFSCVLAICISFVVICLSIYLAYVFNWIICLTKLCIFNMFNIFWIQLLSQIYILQIFSLSLVFFFLS